MKQALAGAIKNQKNLTENQKKFSEFINRGESSCDYERQLLEKHEKRIIAIFQGKIVPPYELEIQPSSICNLNCEHCFGKKLTSEKLQNKIGKEEIELIAKKIDEFKENGFKIESIKFCGTTGDPLVNPATMYGICLFKDLGKEVILFTNGLYLNKKINEKEYADYILKIDRLNLSLDVGSEKTFMQLKGRTGFKKIIENLENLVEKKNQKNPKINVSYVIGEKNYHEIIKLTELIKSIGVDELRFRVDFTNPEKIHKLSGIIIPFLNYAKRQSDENFKVLSPYSEDEISHDDSVFNSYGRRCFTQHLWACIGSDCNLYACGHRTYFGVKPYGSLLKNSFRELWTGKKRIENLTKLPDENCKFCSPFSARANDFMTFLYNISNFH